MCSKAREGSACGLVNGSSKKQRIPGTGKKVPGEDTDSLGHGGNDE